MDIITFLENKMLPCVPFCLFFPCVLSALYCVIFPSCPQIAEAGTKGDMSYLDAPDAYITLPEEERPPSRFFADEGYSLCTSVFFDCLDLKW